MTEVDSIDAAIRIRDVSRETRERLTAYVDLLRHWQRVKNLVGPGTLDRIWTRHVADSLQLADYGPLDRPWLDLGSGAGFPGLVIALVMPPGGHVHLVESNGRKAAFLREAARVTEAPVTVHATRAEDVLPRLSDRFGVVTARAFTSLAGLLAFAHPFVDKGAIALLPKGQDVERELTEATTSWIMDVERLPSRTDPGATILRVTALARR